MRVLKHRGELMMMMRRFWRLFRQSSGRRSWLKRNFSCLIHRSSSSIIQRATTRLNWVMSVFPNEHRSNMEICFVFWVTIIVSSPTWPNCELNSAAATTQRLMRNTIVKIGEGSNDHGTRDRLRDHFTLSMVVTSLCFGVNPSQISIDSHTESLSGNGECDECASWNMETTARKKN